SFCLFSFSTLLLPPPSTLFPYTTLFRSVVSDHSAGVRAAAMHLFHLGHRRIGFIGGAQHVLPTRARAQALLAVCAEHRSLRVDIDRKSTRLNSSHLVISYAVFCLKKKKI